MELFRDYKFSCIPGGHVYNVQVGNGFYPLVIGLDGNIDRCELMAVANEFLLKVGSTSSPSDVTYDYSHYNLVITTYENDFAIA